ncbi:hypothetical protein, partial [Bacteroides sp. 214]|uniref:hypothetical protein n=1 Tax=Bacteroides sp. 214 TaxID=2302935 RepID=UPI0019402EFD
FPIYTTPNSQVSQTVSPRRYISQFRRRTSRNMMYGVYYLFENLSMTAIPIQNCSLPLRVHRQ